MNIVKFKYCDDFHCIGPECQDHCCKEWEILFGKREYLDYKKAKCSKELKDIINIAFERVRDHDKLGINYNERTNYARIKLNENNECPFHGADGLCMMQKEFGEKALSNTCSSFPRMYGLVGGETLIYACSITCPHVVELLMAHPEGLEVVEEEYDESLEGANKGFYSLSTSRNGWKGYPQYWIIKSAQIDILQNRNFTIPERLLILGFFSKKADEYIEAGQGEKIETLYKMLFDNEFCRSITDSLKAPQSDEGAAAKCVDVFLKMYEAVMKTTKRKKLFEQIAQSIDLVNEKVLVDGEVKVRFTYSMNQYFKNLEVFRRIETDRGYIFENVLVNMIFAARPDEGIFKSFFELAIFYNILKISLHAFLNEDWNDGDLALAITYSAKMVVNTHLAIKVSEKDFESHNAFDLPHVAFLIS
ncbi:MAG: flagellin lysine-N-methylase [Ruminiclostridium sp.]|nr:flagellin lysine-N-methylase [Ruminiclostridium sp.]